MHSEPLRIRSLLLAVMLLLPLPVAHVTAAPRTVAHWPMGDTTPGADEGKPVTGKVPALGNDAMALDTAGSPTFTQKVSDRARGSSVAIGMDGRSQLGRKGLMKATDHFAAEAFVRARTNEGFRVILQYGGGTHGWSLVRNGKGYQVMLGGVALIGWSGDVEAGRWVHVALVRDQGRTTFYLNGKPMGGGDQAMHPTQEDSPLVIGRDSEGKNAFEGDIDEVRVFTFDPGRFDPAMLLIHQENVHQPRLRSNVDHDAQGKPLELSIVFDRQPIEQGMTFARNPATQPTTVNVGDREHQAWKAMYNSAPGVGWGKSFYFTINDQRFKEGRQPAVDIEIVYRSTAWAPVELWADTADGSRRVASAWGNSPHWQTLRARIDNAHFAARSFDSEPRTMASDGYDLRLNGYNDDLHIRSIRVVGYDLDRDPNYQRLLRLRGIDHPDDLFLFTPGPEQTLTWVFANLARRPLPVRWSFDLADWSGRRLQSAQGKLNLRGDRVTEIPFTFQTADLPLGVYRLTLRIERDDRPDPQPVFERQSYLGLSFPGRVPKARPGEFLYGLDVMLGRPQDHPRLLGWIDAMGVDIVRGGGIDWDNLDHVKANLPKWETRGVQVLAMSDVPWDPDDARRERQTAERAARLEQVAREMGPRVTWWELGNEPDLTFFYKGPIEAYARGFEAMSAAIHSGDPTDRVANGGLCFAGAQATERATRFMEIVDPDRLGAIAYHGHGPGEQAERAAYQRMHAVADRFHKADRPFIETESGVAARTPHQEIVQARTVVQKITYAQSVRLPLFIWFRLLMFEEDYGNLRTQQEPRPAVLAYRNMTATLRHHRFVREFDAGTDTRVRLFESHDPATPPATPPARRAVVAWSDQPVPARVGLRIAERRIDGAVCIDLFGNRRPATVSDDGIVHLEVGPDPIYLTWTAPDPAFAADLAPPILAAPAEARLIDTVDNPVTLSLTNPFPRELAATLTATPVHLGQDASLTPRSTEVRLAPGQKTDLTLSVRTGQFTDEVRWPSLWTAFIDVRPDLDLTAYTEIPDTLPGPDGPVAATPASPDPGHRIDFEKLGGRMSERRPAVLFAEVWSPVDQEVRVGASADWWMAWHLNGRPVFDTLATGNGGGYAVTDHPFTLPLRKGRNLLAVRVLSGSMGWKVLIASPAQLAVAADPALTPRIDLALRHGDAVLAAATVRVRAIPPVAPMPDDLRPDGPLSRWQRLAPDVVLDESHLANPYLLQPDKSRWWHGPDDLAALGWLRADADRLHLVLAVRDDRHIAPTAHDRPADALVWRITAPDGSKPVQATVLGNPVMERPGTTLYRVSWDRDQLPDKEFRLGLELRDSDDGAIAKQTLTWQQNADLGHRIVLPR